MVMKAKAQGEDQNGKPVERDSLVLACRCGNAVWDVTKVTWVERGLFALGWLKDV